MWMCVGGGWVDTALCIGIGREGGREGGRERGESVSLPLPPEYYICHMVIVLHPLKIFDNSI